MSPFRDVRCPDCRHPIAARRWMRMPDELVCYQCGASLVRGGKPVVRDALLIWLVLMLPATLLPAIGGMVGLIAALSLWALIVPMRPWAGLRYTLRSGERAELPAARAVEHPAQDPPERSLQTRD